MGFYDFYFLRFYGLPRVIYMSGESNAVTMLFKRARVKTCL